MKQSSSKTAIMAPPPIQTAFTKNSRRISAFTPLTELVKSVDSPSNSKKKAGFADPAPTLFSPRSQSAVNFANKCLGRTGNVQTWMAGQTPGGKSGISQQAQSQSNSNSPRGANNPFSPRAEVSYGSDKDKARKYLEEGARRTTISVGVSPGGTFVKKGMTLAQMAKAANKIDSVEKKLNAKTDEQKKEEAKRAREEREKEEAHLDEVNKHVTTPAPWQPSVD